LPYYLCRLQNTVLLPVQLRSAFHFLLCCVGRDYSQPEIISVALRINNATSSIPSSAPSFLAQAGEPLAADYATRAIPIDIQLKNALLRCEELARSAACAARAQHMEGEGEKREAV